MQHCVNTTLKIQRMVVLRVRHVSYVFLHWVERIISRLRRRGWREVLFVVSVWIKGVDGALEIVGGAALISVNPGFIVRVVQVLTQDELTEDPHDLVANYLRRAAARVSFASEHFMSIYLFIHGAMKIVLVWALLRRVLAAYPLSIVVFAGFIGYQLYRYTWKPGVGLLVFSAIDAVVIALIYLEYRALRHSTA